MAVYKLQIKIGADEFNGEGEEESVRKDFADFKSLIELLAAQPRYTQSPPPTNHNPPGSGIEGEVDKAQLDRIYLVDPKQKLVSLKVHPHTSDRDRDAMLLVIFGYQQKLAQQDVPVGQIKQGMRQTGIKVDRVDKVAVKYMNAGYLNKGGSGKGSRYRLTNSGIAKAKELAKAM